MRPDAVQGSWATVPLSSVAEVISGVTKGRKLSGSITNVSYLRVANVQAGHLDLSEVKDIPATDEEIRRYRLLPGDVLMTEGGDPDKLGRGCLWRGELPCCIHQNHIFRVRTNKDALSPEFLAAYLGSPRAKTYFLRAAKQTTGIATINKTQLGEFPVPVLPLPEQHRIAAILDKADAIQRKRKETLRLTEELLRSAFLEMFGDPPADWPVVAMESIAPKIPQALAIGPFGSSLKVSDYHSEGHPVVFVRDVKEAGFLRVSQVFVGDQKFQELQAHHVRPGDVVATQMGLPPCIAAVYPREMPIGVITADIIKISPNPELCVSEYLAAAINSGFCKRQVATFTEGITRPKVTLSAFRRMEILLPPMDVQTRWQMVVQSVADARNNRARSLELLTDLSNALTCRAFRGEL